MAKVVSVERKRSEAYKDKKRYKEEIKIRIWGARLRFGPMWRPRVSCSISGSESSPVSWFGLFSVPPVRRRTLSLCLWNGGLPYHISTVITHGLQIGPMRKCALHFLNIISSLYLILSLQAHTPFSFHTNLLHHLAPMISTVSLFYNITIQWTTSYAYEWTTS